MAVKLENSMEYVALQADIFIPDGIDIEVKSGSRAANHSLDTMRFDDNHLRVALFDLGNKVFTDCDDPIFEIIAEGNVSDIEGLTISNILAADTEANEYVLDFRIGDMTGVESITNDAIRIEVVSEGICISNAIGKIIEVCTLEGQVIRCFMGNEAIETISLSSGLYLVKAGDKTLKVVL